jgi:hypothetical protein
MPVFSSPRRGPADRGQRGEATGAAAEGVARGKRPPLLVIEDLALMYWPIECVRSTELPAELVAQAAATLERVPCLPM